MSEGEMQHPPEAAARSTGDSDGARDTSPGGEEAMTLESDVPFRDNVGQFGTKAQVAVFWNKARAWARRTPVLAAATAFSLLSAVYWIAIATPRYVSEAHVIVQKTDLQSADPTDLASVLTGGAIGNTADQLILRDYLLSRGMMERLEAELTLADHWSQWWIDPLTKPTFANSPEDLYAYYLKRVKVEYDEYAGVLVIQSEGFDPETAQAMTAAMVADGESFMNGMAQSLAERQVSFLQDEVDSLAERAIQARQAVIAYQNQEGLVSPQIAAETITATISRLEARKTEMQIQLASLSSYLVADHPSIVELRQQIEAVDEQIALENARLIGGGDQLNTQVEQFGRLQMEAEFATAVHQTALAALERGRVESTRTIKSMSVIQPPTMPYEAGSPARLYNALVQAIFAFLIAGVIQLLIAIIREHKD